MASTITSLVVLDGTVLPDGADAAIPNGWVAKAVLPDDGVSTFDPTKIVLTVNDPGFDQTGAAVTRTRTIRGGAIIRKQQPNQAQRLNSAAAGVRTVYFSLVDDVYAGSTITGAQAEAGYYGAAAAGAIAGIVNNSTVAYPKPLFSWANKQEERATGAGFAIEAVAVHRHAMNGRQVACMQFIAKDAQGVPNAAPTQTVAVPSLSDFQPTGLRPEVYKATIPLANLTQGDLCQISARVYPWIGDAASVLDLETDGVAWPTPVPQTKLRFLNDKTGGYGGNHAAVKIGAAGGAVGATRAAAEASPFPTIVAAIAALATANGTGKGHADHSGSTIWLMERVAGVGDDHDIGDSSATAAGKCWTEIRVSPSATGTVRAVQSNINPTTSKLCWMVPVNNTGFTAIDGGGTVGKMLAFENMTLTQAGSLQINYQMHLNYFRNVNVASGKSPFFTFGGTLTAAALMLGVTAQGTASGAVAPYAVIGCDLAAFALTEFPTSQASAVSHDGAVIVNTRLTKLGAGAYCEMGNQRPYVRGLGLVQLVIERAGGSASDPAFYLGGDSGSRAIPISNLVIHHCTIPGIDNGERLNLDYTDSDDSVGVQRRATIRFSLFSQYNVKSDPFTTNSTLSGRTGNWRLRYGVGCLGNVLTQGDTNGQTAPNQSGGNWIGEYWEPGSKPGGAAVTFANFKAGVGDVGGGDYRLTGVSNDAYGRVPAGMAVLGYDLAGVARRNDGTGAAGAYETTQNPPLGGAGGATLGSVGESGAGGVAVKGGGGGTLDPVGETGTGGRSPALGAGGGGLGNIGGSGEGDVTDPPITAKAAIIATADRTIALTPMPSGANSAPELPLDAPAWSVPFDPSDRTPFAFDWTALLNGETILQIDRIKMSAAGASLGVEVDTEAGRTPIISTDGTKTQVWFLCDPNFQNNAAFLGGGVQIGLTVRIRTSGNPYKVFERTGILTVRQQ